MIPVSIIDVFDRLIQLNYAARVELCVNRLVLIIEIGKKQEILSEQMIKD